MNEFVPSLMQDCIALIITDCRFGDGVGYRMLRDLVSSSVKLFCFSPDSI